MNILRRELAEHAETLRFWKSLPVDLKGKIQIFYKSQKPTSVCPMCGRLHYCLLCNHYCQPECFLKATKKFLWYQCEEFASSEESV